MTDTHETYADRLLTFTLPQRHVRGRMVRLDSVLSTILSAHDYPTPIRDLLAEALVLAALSGGLLKDDGSQVTIQAQTDSGIVELLACDYRGGELRGYVQFDPERVAQLSADVSLETLFGKGFFDAVQGQKTNVPKKPAPDGVYAIMERLDVSPEETIYVGDSWVDIETGRAAGNFAVGVLWGFRDEEELRAHHADAVITAPGELLELL